MNKRVKVSYLFTLGVLSAQFVDVCFLHTNFSVIGDNIAARIVGIILAFVAAKILDFDLKKRCVKSPDKWREMWYGLLISVIPIAICYICEYIYFRLSGYTDLPLSIVSPNTDYFGGVEYRGYAIAVYAGALLIGTIFKEVFFRAFLITQLSSQYSVKKSIYIQAGLYCLLSIPYVMYCFMIGLFDGVSISEIITILVSYPIINFICGVKWGYFYKINGSIWMSLADHFANNFILTCFYLSPDRLPDMWYVFEVILIQVMSCLMFIPFYFEKDRRNIQVAEDVRAGLEVLRAGGDLYTPSQEKKLKGTESVNEDFVPKKTTDEYSEKVFDRSIMSVIPENRDPDTLESGIAIDEVEEKPNVDSMIKSVKTFEVHESSKMKPKNTVDDVDEEPEKLTKDFYSQIMDKHLRTDVRESNANKNESVSVSNDAENGHTAPSDMAKEYFDGMFDKSLRKEKQSKNEDSKDSVENLNAGGADISGKVKEFFDDNFNKRTFTGDDTRKNK